MTAATSSESVDAAIGALEMGRRAGWAKAFRLESELAEVREELRLARQGREESHRLNQVAAGALEVLAPSLVPWLDEDAIALFVGRPGDADTYSRDRFRVVVESDDWRTLRAAGAEAARTWLAAPAAETDPLDAEALRTLRHYRGGLTGATSP